MHESGNGTQCRRLVAAGFASKSSIRWLFVIARQSTFVYKHRAVDVKLVSHKLGCAKGSNAAFVALGERAARAQAT